MKTISFTNDQIETIVEALTKAKKCILLLQSETDKLEAELKETKAELEYERTISPSSWNQHT